LERKRTSWCAITPKGDWQQVNDKTTLLCFHNDPRQIIF
jgi:hypothetical protein